MKEKRLKLIESFFVVVMTIILLAMVFPVLTKAKENAQTACANNIKQILHAAIMYAEDYNGWWPIGDVGVKYHPPNSYAEGFPWYLLAIKKKYIPLKVYECPADETKVGREDGCTYPLPWLKGHYISYVWNVGMSGFKYSGGGWGTLPVYKDYLKHPEKDVVLADAEWERYPKAGFGPFWSQSGYMSITAFPGPNNKVYGFHHYVEGPGGRKIGGSNTGFADGHVEWVTPERWWKEFYKKGDNKPGKGTWGYSNINFR